MGVHASWPRHSRPRETAARWHAQGARDRRGLHARAHEGVAAPDDYAAEHSARALKNGDCHHFLMSYVDHRFYDELVASFRDWQRPELEVTDAATRDECRRLLEREARLLDEGRFEDWLGLYAEGCVVWVPAAERPGDPRREVAVFFDDRQRLVRRRLGS